MLRPWFRFFRVQNLITVPGDVLVGAVAIVGFPGIAATLVPAIAAVAFYMYGLADNDIVGMNTDPKDRPLVDGSLSLVQARVARGLCLLVPMVLASLANLPPLWWISAFALVVSMVVYNRTKWCVLMGLCRALNVFCGGAALIANAYSLSSLTWIKLAIVFSIWLAYIAGITKYSEREVFDATNGRKVALLVNGLVALQLIAILTMGLVIVKPVDAVSHRVHKCSEVLKLQRWG